MISSTIFAEILIVTNRQIHKPYGHDASHSQW